MVALVGRKSGWLRRIAPGLGGGRAGRSWGGRPLQADSLRGKLYGECLMSPACSEGLGDPLYSATRRAPWRQKISSSATAVAVVAGYRGGDERVPTSGRISTACALGQLACAGGLGGSVRGGIRCRRRRAAKAALQGARGSLEGTGERASAWRGSAGEQGVRDGTRRERQCGVSA